MTDFLHVQPWMRANRIIQKWFLKVTCFCFGASRKSKDQTLSFGSRESFTWVILNTILCLVLDFQGKRYILWAFVRTVTWPPQVDFRRLGPSISQFQVWSRTGGGSLVGRGTQHCPATGQRFFVVGLPPRWKKKDRTRCKTLNTYDNLFIQRSCKHATSCNLKKHFSPKCFDGQAAFPIASSSWWLSLVLVLVVELTVFDCNMTVWRQVSPGLQGTENQSGTFGDQHVRSSAFFMSVPLLLCIATV